MHQTFQLNPKIAKMILESHASALGLLNLKDHDEFTNAFLKELKGLTPTKLSKILRVLFEASLTREEDRYHQFSVYLSPPEIKFSKQLKPYLQKHFCGYFENVASFENPVPISALPKIAPSFESTKQKLRVWFDSNGEIEIWGFAQHYFDELSLEIRTFAPGQLLVHTKPLDFPTDRYLVRLSDTVKVVHTWSLLARLFSESDFEKMGNIEDRENWIRYGHRRTRRHAFVIDIINRMHDHGNGGTLLVVPSESADQIVADSIKQPIPYRPKGGFGVIRRRLLSEENEHVEKDKDSSLFPLQRRSFDAEAEFLGQLTAVDGATVVTADFDVVAFGAKITFSKSAAKELEMGDALTEVWIKSPFEGHAGVGTPLSGFGGTRHQSAAQFVFDHREKNTFAIVASQDGMISIIFWDSNLSRLTALRPAEYLYHGLKF
jgi:hypothetical protein